MSPRVDRGDKHTGPCVSRRDPLFFAKCAEKGIGLFEAASLNFDDALRDTVLQDTVGCIGNPIPRQFRMSLAGTA